jgi:hypothetical protein
MLEDRSWTGIGGSGCGIARTGATQPAAMMVWAGCWNSPTFT